MRKKRGVTYEWVVGIDEVGRGPLAGPVTVCAVAVPFAAYRRFVRAARAQGITDSKQLTPTRREALASELRAQVLEGVIRAHVASASAAAIDKKGIAVCIRQLVARALNKLAVDPSRTYVLLDGSLYAPETFFHQETFVKGDSVHEIIGAASIMAKVHRDTFMVQQAPKYAVYGFNINKGYGTKDHRAAIASYGLCPLHRHSFCTRIDIA